MRVRLQDRRTLPVAAALLLLGSVLLIFAFHTLYRVDVDVYRIGGQMIVEGQSLYGRLPVMENGENLPFTYPPFAALLFTPLAFMPLLVACVLLPLLSVPALFFSLYLVLREVLPVRGRELLTAAMVATAIGIWTDPFRQTLNFGQVNAFIMMCVVIDVIAGRGKWWRGAFIGLAVSFKLTPAVFLAFFLVRRDWRAMVVTVASTALWTGIGFVVRPHDSWRYWTDVLLNTDRIGDPANKSNQSLHGFIQRVAGHDVSRIWWFVGCAIVGIFVLLLIHRLGDDEVTGMTVMGLYGLFASPVSWSHHWMWLAPAFILVAQRAIRDGSRAARVWLVAAFLTVSWGPQWGPFVRGDTSQWNWFETLLGNSWLWLLFGAYAIFWSTKQRVATAPALAT